MSNNVGGGRRGGCPIEHLPTSIQPRAALALLATGALAVGATAGAQDLHRGFGPHTATVDRGGAIYAMTNAAAGNQILVFLRDPKGRLTALPNATTSTGGKGGSVTAGVDPLGSQGALAYDPESEALFAVNAGDNTVAELATGAPGVAPQLRAVVPSGGFIPVSVAVSEGVLYVLNAGGTGSVSSFAIGARGALTALGTIDLHLTPSATAPPFDQVAAPGQVGVDALARHLIVTHAGGRELLTAALDDDGIPVGPIVSTPTPGLGPFAFDVTRFGTTLVAEAASGSVSAFDAPVDATPLTVTAAAVATGQAATCWIVVHDAGFAYVSNTGSNTLGLYAYSRTGGLELLNPTAATPGGAPTDLTLASGGGFLYSLDAASGQISGFAVDAETGALTPVETQDGLPASAGIQGIASRDF